MSPYNLYAINTEGAKMLKIDEIKINSSGYVVFCNKNWSYAGDRYTYAKIDGDKVLIKRAGKGTMSSAYESELRHFCAQIGVDWDSIGCGERVAVEIAGADA